MTYTLENYDRNISNGGRNRRFADDMEAVTEEEQELEVLVESLAETCSMYKMEISAKKIKVMIHCTYGIPLEMGKDRSWVL